MRLSSSSQNDLWQHIRRKILRQTSLFLSIALERPELGVSIPTVPAGRGRFSRAFADDFWGRVLGEE